MTKVMSSERGSMVYGRVGVRTCWGWRWVGWGQSDSQRRVQRHIFVRYRSNHQTATPTLRTSTACVIVPPTTGTAAITLDLNPAGLCDIGSTAGQEVPTTAWTSSLHPHLRVRVAMRPLRPRPPRHSACATSEHVVARYVAAASPCMPCSAKRSATRQLLEPRTVRGASVCICACMLYAMPC